MKELLTKKYAGLPGWAWLAIGVAGIGAGILLIRWQKGKASSTPADLTASTTPDLTTGNASGNESNPETGAVGDNGVINNPFPETTVGTFGNIPIIPPGYQAVYDNQGNIIAFEPIPPGPTPKPPPPPSANPPNPPHQQTFTLTKAWLDAHKHGPLHKLADQFGISYEALYNANKGILGPDINHAKYKAGQTLVIPMASSSTNVNALSVSKRRAA